MCGLWLLHCHSTPAFSEPYVLSILYSPAHNVVGPGVSSLCRSRRCGQIVYSVLLCLYIIEVMHPMCFLTAALCVFFLWLAHAGARDEACHACTPLPAQDIALIDARRGATMFRKVAVPALGIVENMSSYICPGCGREEHIFGQGGAARTEKKQGV